MNNLSIDLHHIRSLRPPRINFSLIEYNPEVKSLLTESKRLERIFSSAKDDAMKKVIKWLASDPVSTHDLGPFYGHELTHELSAFISPHCTEVPQGGRSLAEYSALENFRLKIDFQSADYDTFCDFLRKIHNVVTPGSPTSFRTHAVYSAKDSLGHRIAYPSAPLIHPQLRRIHAYVNSHMANARGLAAVVTMTAIMNTHPFSDGNGRVARIIFNYIMNHGRSNTIYLPIYEISAFSQCGYLLYLRQAQFHAQWHGLIKYLSFCTERLFL